MASPGASSSFSTVQDKKKAAVAPTIRTTTGTKLLKNAGTNICFWVCLVACLQN